MGYIRHHCIVVTSSNDKLLTKARKKACALRGTPSRVSNIIEGDINGYGTFLVGPDGSKEGWTHSDIGDAQRAAFVKWLRAQAYDDGSSSLSWAELQYGDDESECVVVNHQNDNKASPPQGHEEV